MTDPIPLPRRTNVTGQHPAQANEHDDLPTLTLALPAHLDADQTLRGLAQAIGQTRAALARRARQFQRLEASYAASGDQLHRALSRGQALGSQHAAAAIDEAVIETFSLWDQYPTHEPEPHDNTRADPAPPGPPPPQ
jgi:hypothetical protein